MANFNPASLTNQGMALLAKAQVEQATIRFTKAATGNGTYEDDILVDMTELKSQVQEFPISTISIVDDATVYLKFIVSNFHDSTALVEGYYITEVGIFAEDPDEGEILYAIATAVRDQWDYLPKYNDLLPSTITMEFYATVANAEEVYIKAKSGAYVYQEDYDEDRQKIHAELQSVKNPVFEDYTETEVPEPEEAIGQVVSGKSMSVLMQYIKASMKGLLNLAQRALSIAMGRNQARVFATVAALDSWLAVPANVQQLNVGDNFYIVDTDVPDYWWDGNQKQELESRKVDLTTYDQKISELNGNISAHQSSGDHDGRYYTEAEVNNLLAGKADTTHTHNYLPPVWANYEGTISTGNFQGTIYVYKRNGDYKQFHIQGSLLASLAAKSGSRYIGSLPADVYPGIRITLPGITKSGKTIWITIGTNGAVNVENYSLNAAVLEKSDHFEITHVYY